MTFNIHRHDDPDETRVIPRTTESDEIKLKNRLSSDHTRSEPTSDKVGLIMMGMICVAAVLIAIICSIGAVRAFG